MASARKKKSVSRAVADGTANAAVGVTGSVFRVIGTIFLILIVTALLFLCIFAYYVKTCLSTELDVELEDFTVSLSSSILYEDDNGNWQTNRGWRCQFNAHQLYCGRQCVWWRLLCHVASSECDGKNG